MATTSWGSTQLETKWVVLNNDALAGKAENILSCNAAESLGILQINTEPKIFRVRTEASTIHPTTQVVLNDFDAVFKGLGKMKTEPVTLYTKENKKPVIQPPRPIPYHLQKQFTDEILQMEKNDVIEDHEGPVTWISNPVLVPKPDGRLRVTVDLRPVNEALEDPYIPIPRVDDILPMFAGKKVFSKLDLKTAFHQIELHKESRHLTVFRAGDKLKRYKRLTMGSLPATGELNKRLRPILAHLKDVEIIHDDIVIATVDMETHNTVLRQALQIL